jgi:hypothetical protein
MVPGANETTAQLDPLKALFPPNLRGSGSRPQLPGGSLRRARRVGHRQDDSASASRYRSPIATATGLRQAAHIGRLDSCRAAKLIDQHESDAKSHAMLRVQDMRAAGDERGEWVWVGVFDAVLELQATRPAEGDHVH